MGQRIHLGTERPRIKSCVTLGKAHSYLSAKVPLLLLLIQRFLLCVVFTCTCVVVYLSLEGRMGMNSTYLSLQFRVG